MNVDCYCYQATFVARKESDLSENEEDKEKAAGVKALSTSGPELRTPTACVREVEKTACSQRLETVWTLSWDQRAELKDFKREMPRLKLH